MTDHDLDAAYTRLARTMTALGEAQAPLFLARFALLAMTQLADRAKIERMIEDAAADLAAPPNPETP
jgi:hypothetical protein